MTIYPNHIRTAKMVSIRAPVTIEAAKKQEGETESGPPTFAALAYGGGVVPGYTSNPPLELPYVLDLAGMTAARNVVANLDHEPKQRVGHVTQVENTKKELRVSGLLSAATVHRQEVVNNAADGFPWEVSIEGDLTRIATLKDGASAVVNGQTVHGPLYIVRKSKLTGLAFVSQGADDRNAVSIAASAAGATPMNEFEQWLGDNGFENPSDEQRGVLRAAFDNRNRGAAVTKTTLSEIADEERQEYKRQESINRIALTAIRENKPLIDQIENMANEALADPSVKPDHFELSLLRRLRTSADAFVTKDKPQADYRVMAAALCQSAGLPNIEKHFTEQVLEAVDKFGYRHFGLQQLLLEAAGANGYDSRRGERIHQGNLRTVLEYAFPPAFARIKATQFSTINLPSILSTVANTELLAGFGEEDQSWREISRVATVTNFYQVQAFRLTDSLEYEELPKGGEIKHGTLGEESYTRQAKTYAKMLGLDRQDIINDDLTAFDDLRTRLGRGAAKKLNNVFWAEFMNNASFFTTARGNYITGATTNLGTDGVGLGLGVAAFKALESSDGSRIGGQPSILLVPPELSVIADQLFVGGGGDQIVSATNVFKGKYRPVEVPYLSDSSFTGYSTTAWYLVRNPAILAAMVVSFLNGNQTPTVESTDADFYNLGILFRGYHDFGTDQAEYLAGIKSKGAA